MDFPPQPWPVGQAEQVEPLVRRVLAPNPSPFTYTAGSSRETVYIFGGTVSNVSLGGTQIAAASPTQVQLAPGEAVTVTYSVAPSMVKDIH